MSATRARIEANIAESAAARNSSNFEVYLAKSDQISGSYLPDQWSLTSLNVGDKLIGGLPGQTSFYTNFRTLDAAANSRQSLFESLQVDPHPEFGFRPKVGVYEVQESLPRIPTGTTNANPLKGAGGDQFCVRGYDKVLKLIDEIHLGQ